jgi:Predicted solute binding protein
MLHHATPGCTGLLSSWWDLYILWFQQELYWCSDLFLSPNTNDELLEYRNKIKFLLTLEKMPLIS